MIFTYGANGVDFEAALGAATIRVALAAPAAGTEPGATGRRDDSEGRLEVTYSGPEAGPRYVLTVLAPPHRHDLEALQVARVEGANPEERIEFRYGQAAAPGQAGSFAPTVLREIVLPKRSLELDWAERPGPRLAAAAGGGGPLGAIWHYGVGVLRDRRLGGGVEAEAATCWQAAPHEEGRASGPGSWVRQSRHFALDEGPGAGPACRTHVRDRWGLESEAETGGETGDPGLRCAYREGDDIPTLEWDAEARILVPVPGQFTRWMNWSGEPGQAPDLHGGRPPGGPGRLRLLGGMYRPRAPYWREGIEYDETRHRMTVPSAEPKGQEPKEPGLLELYPREVLERVEHLSPKYDPAKGEVTLETVVGRRPKGSGEGWGTGGGGGAGSAPETGIGERGAGAGIRPRPSQPRIPEAHSTRAEAGLAVIEAQAAASRATRNLAAQTADLQRRISESAAAQQTDMTRRLETMALQADAARAQAYLASEQQDFAQQQQVRAARSAAQGAALAAMGHHVATRAAEARQEWAEAAEEAATGALKAAENTRAAAESRRRASEAELRAAEGERKAAEHLLRVTEVRGKAAEAGQEAAESEHRVAALQRQTAEILERARLAAARKARANNLSRTLSIPYQGVPPPAPVPVPNPEAIEPLHSGTQAEAGRPGEVLFWDWEGTGDLAEGGPGQSEPEVENKGEAPQWDPYSLAGPPVPGWPKLAGPLSGGERPTEPGSAGSSLDLEHLKNWWTGGGWNKDVDAERIRIVRTVEGWHPDVPDYLRAPERYIDYNQFGEVVQVRDVRGIQDDSATTLAIVTGAKIAHDVGRAATLAVRGQAGSQYLMPIAENRTAHIFRQAEGHLLDTPANRQLLSEVANNKSLSLGTDRFGNTWAAQIRADGSQVWTQCRDGKIINGGINKTPRTYNPTTGLSNPEPPR